jgi:hypothetical protein
MDQVFELGLSAEQIEGIDVGLDYHALNLFASPMEWDQYLEASPIALTFQEADIVTDMVEDSDMVEETHMTDESDDDYSDAHALTPKPAEEADNDYPDEYALTPKPAEEVDEDYTEAHALTRQDLGLVDFDHSVIEARHSGCSQIPDLDLFPEVNDQIFDQSKSLEAGLLVPYVGETVNYQQNLQTPVPELHDPIVSPVFEQTGALQPFLFNGAQFGENQQLADQQLINLQPMQGFLDLPQQVQANPLPFQMPPPMIIQNFFAAGTINVSYDRRDQVACQ